MPLFEAAVTASIGDLPPAAEIGGLVATSARAFGMFEGVAVDAEGLETIPVHAVGPATAQAARDAGFVHVDEGGGTAQALAQALVDAQARILNHAKPRESSIASKPLVYLAGVPRTQVIEAALAARSVDHTVVECYKMSEISYSTDIAKTDILSPAPEVVLFYSANAARRFAALAEDAGLAEALESSWFLCFSPTIADELPGDWRPRVSVAERPDEDSLLASLAGLG